MRRAPGPLLDASRDPRRLDHFGPLLILTIIAVVTLSLFDLDDSDSDTARTVGATIVSLVSGATLLLALRASGAGRRWRRYAEYYLVVVTLATVVSLVLDLATDGDVRSFAVGGGSIVWVAVAATAPVAVVSRLLQHERVTVRTMLGAISAYLLIAVAFTYVFLWVEALGDADFFAQGSQATTSFMYFSLVTVTTLGYGDLSPATEVGRLLATTEAVIGQVYLVTFVALFVGLLINQRRE